MTKNTRIPLSWRMAAVVAVAGVALAGCGATTSSPAPDTGGGSSTGAASQVLPVTQNPIANASTVQALTIDSVLVENNVDPTTGATTDDHLEIVLSNTGATELSGFEVFYTFTDPTANTTESYYLMLPDSFTIPAGGQRVANFDNTGAADHFPVNTFSLYYLSTNALEVSVNVSATDAAVQTTTVMKDAGGPETAD